MKLEVIGREVIKPASPAPQDHLQLSLLDFSVPAVYISTFFFYKCLAGESSEIISRRLKSSLSKTLSRFYPLAGRIEGVSIKCNDEGAVFTEARTDLLLSDFLQNNLDSLGEFLPHKAPGESAGTWPLLSVTVTFFGSGSGVAVALATSHIICDAASVLTLAQGWAATTTTGESNDVAVPQFPGAAIYPPPQVSTQMDDLSDPRGKEFVTNRFVFKSSNISELKRKTSSESVHVPTRVEAITSLIWKCAIKAARSNAPPKSTVMCQAMDLRLRVPSNVLSPFAIGNLISSFYLKKGGESEMEIGEIVNDFRKAKDEVNQIIKESLQDHNSTSTLGLNLLSVLGTLVAELNTDLDLFAMSSWCRKPFYEVDFGWGTPVWMGTTWHTNTASVVLMDTKDGQGVEAWVALPKQDMNVLITEQELLTYAVLNPPVVI